jgi:hypothetical protein
MDFKGQIKQIFTFLSKVIHLWNKWIVMDAGSYLALEAIY